METNEVRQVPLFYPEVCQWCKSELPFPELQADGYYTIRCSGCESSWTYWETEGWQEDLHSITRRQVREMSVSGTTEMKATGIR